MAYIGKQPIVGNYQVLDALTATTTDTYALTKNSVAVFPQTPANCIVSLNGVIQAPFDSYTISGSNIVFASALTASDSIDFITVLGDVLNVGTVSDGTIGISKLSATGTPSSSTFLRGDNSWQEAGGGKVLQVVNYINNTEYSTTSSSYQDAFSTTFTPTLSSSKVLILCNIDSQKGSTDCNIGLKLLRDGSVSVGEFTTLLNTNNSQLIGSIQSFNLLDTPATTSAITYKIQFKVGGSGTVHVGAYTRKSTLTFLEIAG